MRTAPASTQASEFAREDAMSQEHQGTDLETDVPAGEDYFEDHRPKHSDDPGRYRGEVYSKRVPAGKRTYFFDIKTTRSGEDYFLTITESKRIDESRYEKHKIFLYKEDFGKFVSAMHEVISFVRDECLPGYEFRGLPELSYAKTHGESVTKDDA